MKIMMSAVKWKLKEFYRRQGKLKTILLLMATVGTVILTVQAIRLYLKPCSALLLGDFLGYPRPRFLCANFHGGLGNQMFIYAFSLGMARERTLELIINKDNILTKYFLNIKPNTMEDYGYNSYTCNCFWQYEDYKDCGYESRFETLPSTDLRFHGYFQSWRYWIKYKEDVREAFHFHYNIVRIADSQLRNIISQRNISIMDTVLIGVHIRNGDYSKLDFADFGYTIAPPSYLTKATNYYRRIFKKTLFIVCTNDMPWATKALKARRDVHFVTGNDDIIDMALLSMTNHTVMTVGTYGWMISFLTGGTVIHYKYPFVPGSRFETQFSNVSDHFYPGWIAME